jgi:hypothetical protein
LRADAARGNVRYFASQSRYHVAACGKETLPRATLVRVEPNRSSSLYRGKGISVCSALSVETVFWRSGVSFAASINSRTRLPLFDAGHKLGY